MGRHVKGRCRRCGATLTLPVDPDRLCAWCRLARALLANRPPVELDGQDLRLAAWRPVTAPRRPTRPACSG